MRKILSMNPHRLICCLPLTLLRSNKPWRKTRCWRCEPFEFGFDKQWQKGGRFRDCDRGNWSCFRNSLHLPSPWFRNGWKCDLHTINSNNKDMNCFIQLRVSFPPTSSYCCMEYDMSTSSGEMLRCLRIRERTKRTKRFDWASLRLGQRVNVGTCFETRNSNSNDHWCYQNEFDLALASDCTHFQDHHAGLMITLADVLKVGGVAILCQPTRADSLDNFVTLCQLVVVELWELRLLKKGYNATVDERHEESSLDPNYEPNLHYPQLSVLTKKRRFVQEDWNLALDPKDSFCCNIV